jgi:hypothetical protein
MRITLAIAIAATFAFAAWWNLPTLAGPRPATTVSIDPTVLTMNAKDMPVQEYYPAF